MATTTVTASTSDGSLSSTHATYTTAADGGTLATDPGGSNDLWVGQLLFGDYACYESFVAFDLSSIPAHHTITSATLRTYLVTDNTGGGDFTLGAREYDWGTTAGTNDWRDRAELTALTPTLASLDTNGIGAAGNKNWSSAGSALANAVEDNIGGTLKLVLYSGNHRNGFAPTGAEYVELASADVAGTGNDPGLILEHVGVLVDHTPTGGVSLGGTAEVHPLWEQHPEGGAVVTGTSGFAYGHGKQGVDSDITIEWDFDNDGDFDGTDEDITSYVLAAETVTGRSSPSNLTGQTEPGRLRLSLVNDDDRFTYFNASSPLNTGSNSLKAGRKIRVRTTEATPDDPVLLVRDRFNRADGAIGTTETGQTWTTQDGSAFAVADRVASAPDTYDAAHISTVDCGENDYYAQVEMRQLTSYRYAGLILRHSDTNNFAQVRMYMPPMGTGPWLQIRESVAGTLTVLTEVQLGSGWEGMTIGASVEGDTVKAYVGGVELLSATLNAANSTSSNVGLYAYMESYTGRTVEFNDFHVWDKVAAPVEGILWTGNVVKVTTDSVPGRKVATVEAEGVLAKVARPDIGSPRLPLGGAPTGVLIGDALHRAGVLHPPAPLDEGAVTTGPVGIPDGKALTLARAFEAVEQGYVYETNEGQVSFHDSTSRAAATPAAYFSDEPGAQFGYSSISPQDHVSGVINRATAGVAASAPTLVDDGIARNGSGHVDVLMPTLTPGELVIVFVASAVDGDDWGGQLWWVDHRNMSEGLGLRVWSHWVGSDAFWSGKTVRLYSNDSGASGTWVARIYRVRDWFGSYRQGIAMGEPTYGADPGPLVHGWGRYPTLFLAARAGIKGTGGGISLSSVSPPDGYSHISGTIASNGTVAQDSAIAVAYKFDCTDEENPTAINGLSNISSSGVDETVVFAVRGYNGPYTKATLDNPNLSRGGEGVFVTAEDVDSQDDHNGVLPFEAPALFATEAAAESYVDSVIVTYADDRPVVTISFPATFSQHFRSQAIRRRVGDKITLIADGAAGLGVRGDFHIENVGHRWESAGKVWTVTWQLSPA